LHYLEGEGPNCGTGGGGFFLGGEEGGGRKSLLHGKVALGGGGGDFRSPAKRVTNSKPGGGGTSRRRGKNEDLYCRVKRGHVCREKKRRGLSGRNSYEKGERGCFLRQEVSLEAKVARVHSLEGKG